MNEPSVDFNVKVRQVQFSVPVELIRKNLKTLQKQIEKAKKQATEEITRFKKNPRLSNKEKAVVIRKIIKTIENLNAKLASCAASDSEYRLRLVVRAQHLDKIRNFTLSTSSADLGSDVLLDLHNPGLINWYRDETNLLIVDYLLKANTKRNTNVGRELMLYLEKSLDLPISKLVDADVYDTLNRVYLSIVEDHDLASIKAWFNENKAALKKINSNLQFEIIFCEYLAMVESGDEFGAVSFSRTSLSEYARKENYGDDLTNYEANLKRLTKVGTPLVASSALPKQYTPRRTSNAWLSLSSFSPSSGTAKRFKEYRQKTSQETWMGLAEHFLQDFTEIFGIPKTYPLLVYLLAGLSSLKTRSCYCNDQNTIFKQDVLDVGVSQLDSNLKKDYALRGPNHYYRLLGKINQCPVCSPELHKLSLNLPYAQLITNIFNDPFKLPNGNIYPIEKLLSPPKHSEAYSEVRDGKVRDPLTLEVFFIDDCKRVFPA